MPPRPRPMPPTDSPPRKEPPPPRNMHAGGERGERKGEGRPHDTCGEDLASGCGGGVINPLGWPLARVSLKTICGTHGHTPNEMAYETTLVGHGGVQRCRWRRSRHSGFADCGGRQPISTGSPATLRCRAGCTTATCSTHSGASAQRPGPTPCNRTPWCLPCKCLTSSPGLSSVSHTLP